MAKKDDKKDKVRCIKIGPSNFISQLFFLWIFWLIPILRHAKDLKDLNLILRKKTKTDYNDAILDKAWKKELLSAAQKKKLFLKPVKINVTFKLFVCYLKAATNQKSHLQVVRSSIYSKRYMEGCLGGFTVVRCILASESNRTVGSRWL
jgi:hypothetical protein